MGLTCSQLKLKPAIPVDAVDAEVVHVALTERHEEAAMRIRLKILTDLISESAHVHFEIDSRDTGMQQCLYYISSIDTRARQRATIPSTHIGVGSVDHNDDDDGDRDDEEMIHYVGILRRCMSEIDALQRRRDELVRRIRIYCRELRTEPEYVPYLDIIMQSVYPPIREEEAAVDMI